MSLNRFTKEVEVQTAGELRKALATCPDSMPVTDAVGESIVLLFYDDAVEGGRRLVVA
jgi:hypothetical protein